MILEAQKLRILFTIHSWVKSIVNLKTVNCWRWSEILQLFAIFGRKDTQKDKAFFPPVIIYADKRHRRQIVIDEMQAECTNQIVSNVSNVIQGINYVYVMKYLTVKLKSRAVQWRRLATCHAYISLDYNNYKNLGTLYKMFYIIWI